MPDNVPTVQSGLDDLADGDTLFVRAGVYHEALVAPVLHFVMLGEFATDSSEINRPLIDASELQMSDTIPVLLLRDSSAVTIKRFWFKNRNRAGIVCRGNGIIIDSCVIDSAFKGFEYSRDSANVTVHITNSLFRGNIEGCVQVRRGNSLRAVSCEFSGGALHRRTLVTASNSFIDSCKFHCDFPKSLLYCWSGPHIVSNCRFGPAIANFGEALVCIGQGAVQFNNNVFEDCVFDSHVLRVQSTLGDSVSVVGNIFHNCTGSNTAFLAQGVLGNGVEDTDAQIGPTLSDNLFVECSGNSFVDDIYLVPFSPSLIIRNRFVRDRWNGIPSIAMSPNPGSPTPAVLRDNVFEECGYAVLGHGAADGRFNYWGHASGPYHETLNPAGLGDTLTGDMQFIPWLTDTTTNARETHIALPTDVRLDAYPNPFNSTTRLSVTLNQSQNAKLVVFDVLGRAVMTLADKHFSSGTHEVYFDGETLTSGLYFARLQTIRNSVTTKLVLVK